MTAAQQLEAAARRAIRNEKRRTDPSLRVTPAHLCAPYPFPEELKAKAIAAGEERLEFPTAGFSRTGHDLRPDIERIIREALPLAYGFTWEEDDCFMVVRWRTASDRPASPPAPWEGWWKVQP